MARDSICVFVVPPKTCNEFLYGFSVLSGPALAIGIASIWCFYPFHNVLEEPCYWYEFQIAMLLCKTPFTTLVIHPVMTEYWANLSMNGTMISCIILYIIVSGIRILTIAIYYFKWTGFAQPMPVNDALSGTIAYFGTTIAALFR